jgi:1-Cys peroxiredoxin (EC 1.11.1.15)
VPPPGNVEEAGLRLKQYKGYAWWFTYSEAPKEEAESKELAPT